jgi:hypothetical protein
MLEKGENKEYLPIGESRITDVWTGHAKLKRASRRWWILRLWRLCPEHA